MSLLALDLSLTATGWATSVDEHGVFRTSSKGVERLDELDRWLADLLEGVDRVFLEGYAYAKGGQAHQVGEWGGVARLGLYRMGVPFVEVPPATLKKFATGRGNAPKPDMRMELFKRSGLDVPDDNTVDALWLLAVGYELTGEPLWPMPKVNVSALESVMLRLLPEGAG